MLAFAVPAVASASSVTSPPGTLAPVGTQLTGTGTASFTLKEDIASLTCTYTGTAVPFTYAVGGSSITISEGSLVASPPACGGEKISGTFALAKSGGGAVALD